MPVKSLFQTFCGVLLNIYIENGYEKCVNFAWGMEYKFIDNKVYKIFVNFTFIDILSYFIPVKSLCIDISRVL